MFGSDAVSAGSGNTEPGDEEADAAPGVEIAISTEGYAYDTYMLAFSLPSLLAMLALMSKRLRIIGHNRIGGQC